MLKAIFFDFDGVIGNTYGLSFKIFQQLNPSITEQQFQDYFNGNIYELPGTKLNPRILHVFFKKQRAFFSKKNLFPLKNILKKLSKQYKLFIISSNTNTNIEHYLSLGSLNIFFTEILGATTHKSKIEKFNSVFKRYAIKPIECLFITDTTGDIMEANKANVPVIAVSWGFHPTTLLKLAKPAAIASTKEELIRNIQNVATME